MLIFVSAVLLLELLSAAQYFLTHNLIEDELEKHAELELTMKAIILKGMVDGSEHALKSHIMEVKNSLGNPDSLHGIAARIAKYYPHLRGCGIAFKPNYYQNKGNLFEPYALKTDTGIVFRQVAGNNFDYTKDGFYTFIQEKKTNSWVGPYNDIPLGKKLISYAVPIYEFNGDTVAVLGIDIETDNLGDTLNYRHLYPSSFDFLLTEQGELIAGPTEPSLQRELEELVSIINDSTVIREKSENGRTTIIYTSINGRDCSVFYANMRGQPRWQLAVVCYDDEVYAPLWRLRFRLLLLSLVAFGILLYMIYRFAQGEKELHLKTLEQERTDGELRVAHSIQQTLLPADELSLKGTDEVQVEGCLIPAKAVGGDLYNVFVRDGKLFFCIGDVSGKGVPSALIMAIIQALFRNIASTESSPSQIIKRLNETACRNNSANIFSTLFVGVLDLSTGHLRYCNAGHELPILIEKGEEAKSLKGEEGIGFLEAKPNLPVGLFDDIEYEMQTMTMKPGSALFLYTDGLTEARNAEHLLFGRDRMLKMITDSVTTDPKLLVGKAINAWHHFIGTTEQSDDLTLLVLRYTPLQEKNIMDDGLTLHNDVKEVEALGSFVKQVAAQLDLDKSLTGKLRLAVEEAVVNVMEYAYPAGTQGEVNIRAASDGRSLKFIITDTGVSFDPTKVSAADTTLTAEERSIGGLGILIVRELMDSINYERIRGKNVLTLVKNLPRRNEASS